MFYLCRILRFVPQDKLGYVIGRVYGMFYFSGNERSRVVLRMWSEHVQVGEQYDMYFQCSVGT